MCTISEPLKIYCDNNAATPFTKNDKWSNASQYLEVKYPVLKEKVQDHLVSIVGIPTNLMIVDPLMKALTLRTYKEHVLNVGLYVFP